MNKVHFALSIVFVIVSTALTQMTSQSKTFSFALPDIGEAYSVVLCIALGWFVQQVVLFEPHHKVTAWLERTLGRFAKLSYTLYLSHQIVLLTIFSLWIPKQQGDISLNAFGIYLVIVAACLTVAYVLYWLAERHTQAVKAIIKRKLRIA